MGDYRLPETLAELEFDDLPGLLVTVRISPVPLGDYFAAHEVIYTQGERDMLAWFTAIAEAVAPHLVSWTLPEEPTLEGLLAQPYQIVYAIGRGWATAVATVPVPLGRRSSDGDTSEETSPTSSPEPDTSTPPPDATA